MPKPKELANAIRFIAMDAVERANSGHPGAPLGMADMAEVLWNDFMKHNPANPEWWNRDRFVLSNGHASMLLYATLHLTGYALSMDDIKKFRQLGSKTPGHPEYGVTPGVELTTGPLGQGIATAVGMALAEQTLAAEFNREGHEVIDHFTYVFLGDGCLMEGISHETCSLAGTLGLGKLIALWDDNGISIDGPVKGWFTDDTPARFKAYGWHVIAGVDGHDAAALKKAIAKARKVTDKPSLICCKTTIAKGAQGKEGSAASHGSPLGAAEIAAARKNLNWSYEPFVIPQDIKAAFDARKKGAAAEKKWQKMYDAYAAAYPKEAAELTRRMKGELPADIDLVFTEQLTALQKKAESKASRVSSKEMLDVIAPQMPELLGGSADLSGSVGTAWKGHTTLSPANKAGRYIEYGVREFGMGAIMNGLALHGGYIPYAGTFLVFADYAKNAMRLSALMQKRVVWVLTHDSIMMGEDGPTHQPIEQLGMLRLTPNTDVWRPCDGVETAAAWQAAVQREEGPTCLCLSRQNLPTQPREGKTLQNVRRGAYILKESKGTPDVILLATGSEVALAMAAADALEKKGTKARVVSMPCAELFDRQDCTYREQVLPHAVRQRVAIEASACDWWGKYVGLDGAVVGMHGFGDSAPGNVLYQHFGFTVEAVVKAVKDVTAQSGKE
ncbi:transketolase [Desulfovibrio cuneatus]|uniref:transketolase n=1 Tax=Desulfovibrio cuneatus TaxID=159728 RepID=UPI00041D1053|nr:transketolase [Desulfovibrio cuneatus]